MCLGAPFVMLLLVSASSADDTARVDYWITLLDANRPRLAIEIEAPAVAEAATEMRMLVRQAREERREFTVDDLIAEIGRWSDAQTAAEVRAVALEGAELELPVDIFGPDYRLLPTTATSFELGFDFERTRAAKVITGLVAGSAAERAGLHEGDALRGLSLTPGQPDSPVVISIVTDPAGAAKEVRYLPQGKPCQSWRLERATRSTQAAQADR